MVLLPPKGGTPWLYGHKTITYDIRQNTRQMQMGGFV